MGLYNKEIALICSFFFSVIDKLLMSCFWSSISWRCHNFTNYGEPLLPSSLSFLFFFFLWKENLHIYIYIKDYGWAFSAITSAPLLVDLLQYSILISLNKKDNILMSSTRLMIFLSTHILSLMNYLASVSLFW